MPLGTPLTDMPNGLRRLNLSKTKKTAGKREFDGTITEIAFIKKEGIFYSHKNLKCTTNKGRTMCHILRI